MNQNLEPGEIVLCTVDRIVGTVVFVKIDGLGEGSIIMSEIAPGRIRNLRDYVVPKKRIVCKVLRVSGDRIDLSLRRVTQKEQKEVLEKHNQEKSFKAIFKSVLGKERFLQLEKKIEEKETFFEFVENIKEDSKELEKEIGKENSKKILEILKEQKQKEIVVKKEILFNTSKPNGLELIKKIFEKVKSGEKKYISAGKYLIQVKDKDVKSASNKLKQIIEEIEKVAKNDDINIIIK